MAGRLLYFRLIRAIWTTSCLTQSRSIFHARLLAHRDAKRNGDTYVAVQKFIPIRK